MNLPPLPENCVYLGIDSGTGQYYEGAEGPHTDAYYDAEQVRQAQREAVATAVPEGYKLVPIEPTEAMIQAGCFSGYQEVDGKKPLTSYADWADNSSSGIVDRIRGYVERDYKAMLAASPTPEGCETCTTHCRADELGRECVAGVFGRSDGKSQTAHELDAMKKYIEKITKDKDSAVGFLTRAGIIDGSGELAEQYRNIESKGLT